MRVENQLHHSDEQWAALKALNVEGPVCMVNLLRFRDRAEYADGRETGLTGVEAYQLYGQPMGELIRSAGGSIVHTSQPIGMVVGEVEDLWHAVAIVEYPSLPQFIELIERPDVQALQHHRAAGLEGQLNICTQVPPASPPTG